MTLLVRLKNVIGSILYSYKDYPLSVLRIFKTPTKKANAYCGVSLK